MDNQDAPRIIVDEPIGKKDDSPQPEAVPEVAALEEQPVPPTDAPPAADTPTPANDPRNLEFLPPAKEGDLENDEVFKALRAINTNYLNEAIAIQSKLARLGVMVPQHLNVPTLIMTNASVEALKECLCQTGVINRNLYMQVVSRILPAMLKSFNEELQAAQVAMGRIAQQRLQQNPTPNGPRHRR